MAVVALTRQHSSLGHSIGCMVADRLGYRVVDNTTVHVDAAQHGVWIEANGPDLEEHSPTLLERLRDERERNRAMLRCAVANAAALDDVIIIGLASAVILGDVQHVLKVAIIASDEVRVARLQAQSEAEGRGALSNADALRMLRRSDRQRADYLRYHFNAEWLDPFAHDLVINTNRSRAEHAVTQILQTLERPEFQPTAESRERLTDLALNCQIDAEQLGHRPPPDDPLASSSWNWLR